MVIYLHYYQTWCSRGCSTNTFVIHQLIHELTNSFFSSKSSRHLHSLTKWAKFWEHVHFPPCVTRQMSYVMCSMSSVICHVSCVIFIFFGGGRRGQSVGASWWRLEGLLSAGLTWCSRGCSTNTFTTDWFSQQWDKLAN